MYHVEHYARADHLEHYARADHLEHYARADHLEHYARAHDDYGGTHDDACARRVRRRAVRGGLEHVRAVRRRQVLNRSGRHERRHMQQLRRRDILHRSGRRERGHLRAVCRRQVLHCGRVGVPLPGWHLRRGRERRVRPVRGGHLLPEVHDQHCDAYSDIFA